MRNYRPTIIFLFVLHTNLLWSQQLIFHLVPPPEDIPWKLITGITQDPQGYMWFASNQGLNRYDGFKVTHYVYDPFNKNSLANNRIECIYADSKGMIWAGMHGYGLDRFDPINNVFTHFNNIPGDKTSLINDTVTAILEDHEKNIWIGTYGGLDLLNIKTGKFRRFSHIENDSTSLSNNHVRALYEDREGTIWVGTGSPFINDKGVVPNEGGLNRLDRKTGKFIRYMHDPNNSHSLVDNRVRAIYEDRHGNFWVGTAGDGLHSMDRATGSFTRHPYDSLNPQKLSRPPVRNIFPWCNDHITFITEDATGALWIGTISGGLNRYNPNTGEATFYGWGDSLTGFNDYSGWWAYASRDGVLWISTLIGNLFRVDPLHENFPFYELGNDDAGCIYEDSAGIWIGSSNGLVLTAKGDTIKKRYVYDSLNKNSISNTYVDMICKDQNGKLWVSTYGGGFNHFDQATGKFKRFQHDPKNKNSLINNTVITILLDKDQNLWLGTFDGLDKMDTKTERFTHYQHSSKDTNSLSDNAIQCLLNDKSDQLWIGNGSFGGVNVLNKQTGVFAHYFKGSNISSLFQDAKGIVWISTSNGIFSYNSSTKKFTPFIDPNTGVQIKNVQSITEDNQKNLWLFCPVNILKVNGNRSSLVIYGKYFGVKSNLLNFVKSLKGPKGNILCGTQNGYYDFFPESITANATPPQIALTDFFIDEQLINPGSNSPLKTALSQTREIDLNYKQNIFSFEFAVLHYSDPENNQYRFMLQNYDKTWRNAGTEKKAFYFNVPPGHYIFRIRASNNIGIWAEKNISIIITPPWWQTWWFWTIVVLLLIGLFYVIIKVRVRIVRREERLKSGYEKELLELEAKALRAQMNPHFIFNCMNSIKSLIQKNDQEKSILYLTTFSKLIRTVFQNSDKREISLYDEIETCRLYTQLESMRFSNRFNYQFNVDETLDLKSIMVPALIIQPFIENAIWHGIMPKNEEGTVTVTVAKNDNTICCIIDDDGIGREVSKQNKFLSADAAHQSKGEHLTQARLDLDNILNERNATIEIVDKKDGSVKPIGTKVIISFSEY